MPALIRLLTYRYFSTRNLTTATGLYYCCTCVISCTSLATRNRSLLLLYYCNRSLLLLYYCSRSLLLLYYCNRSLRLLYLRHIVHQPRHTRLRCLDNLFNRERQLVDIDILDILVPGCRYFSTRLHTTSYQLIAPQLLLQLLLQLFLGLAPPPSAPPFQSLTTTASARKKKNRIKVSYAALSLSYHNASNFSY